MSSAAGAPSPDGLAVLDDLVGRVDDRTLEILEGRGRTASVRHRGWLVRRMLLLADVVGLTLAFALALALVAPASMRSTSAYVFFVLTIPGWIVLAKLCQLYDHDEERAEHATVDEIVGVMKLVTGGIWLSLALAWLTGVLEVDVPTFLSYWAFALVLITVGRSAARTAFHKRLTYLQNTVIVGAGDVGQLVARKLLQHPEYGINLVGFIDSEPKEQRRDLASLTVLGTPERLPAIVDMFDIERVIVAFSNESHQRTLELIRSLRDKNVHIDIVPRLFEALGPNMGIHAVEGLPLLGLPPAKLSRSSLFLKRLIDIAGASLGLILAAPLFAVIAVQIKRDSPGPVFFRQTRLGLNMREFTILKFRTMRTGTSDQAHRDHIREAMDPRAPAGSNGLYKLDASDTVTRVGRWLRRTSLDELPQLLNVLRGDMSLVGPRPSLPYELDHFEPHHFERFLVPAGLTGLWQVTARSRTTWSEALDMDVSYARGWSLRLDVRLLLQTPIKALKGTA